MGIAELPNEIAREIFSYLLPKDLMQISLSSRYLHEIVESSLYSKFVQTRRTAIPLLTRTLLSTPRLRPHMHTLSLLSVRKSFAGDQRQLGPDVLTPTHHAQIRTFISSYLATSTFPTYTPHPTPSLCAQQWTSDILQRTLNFECTAAFLLLLLPNLEELSVRQYEVESETILGVLCAAGDLPRSQNEIQSPNPTDITRLGSLSKLRVLNLDISDDYGDLLPVRTLLRISCIPSLRDFTCTGVQQDSSSSFIDEPRPSHDPSMQHLTLQNFQVRLPHLQEFLPRFNQLRSLVIRFSDSWGVPPHSANVFTSVVRCLSPCWETLENLTIVNTLHRGRVTSDVFPSLRAFVRLRAMDIEGDYLEHPGFTFASLPHSLEVLTLRTCYKEQILRHLAVDKRELDALPRLERVDVHVRRYAQNWTEQDEMDLPIQGFQNRGIALRVGPVPFA